MLDVGSCLRSARINDMQQQSGLRHFLESGPEGAHEGRRQIADEPDGVAEQNTAIGRQGKLTDGWIERREHACISDYT
jgi:hypothetical protein